MEYVLYNNIFCFYYNDGLILINIPATPIDLCFINYL